MPAAIADQFAGRAGEEGREREAGVHVQAGIREGAGYRTEVVGRGGAKAGGAGAVWRRGC